MCENYYEAMESFIQADLLLLDAFFTSRVTETNALDTFEIMGARVDKGSVVISSLPVPFCLRASRGSISLDKQAKFL